MYCPECRTDYREGFDTCADCNVRLVDGAAPEELEPVSAHPIEVFVTSNVHEANLIRGLLEANGLAASVVDQNLPRLNPFLTNAIGGIKVVVPETQAAAAREVLAEYRPESPGTGTFSPLDSNDDETAGGEESKP